VGSSSSVNQTERRQKQGTAASFDQAASAYDRIGPRFFVHFGEHLVEQAEIQAGAKVLDVACGRGAALYPAARQVGASGLAIGIDLSGAMLRETAPEIASRSLKNIRLLQMDAEHLAFADSSFEFAFCALAIFFFPRPQLGLAEMYRVLKPGGQIGITSFADDCETTHRQRELFNRYMAVSAPPSGNSSQLLEMPFGTSDLLEKALREVGFRAVRSFKEKADFVYRSDEEWWSWFSSTAYRRRLDQLTPSDREELKGKMLRELQVSKQDDGIHQPRSVLFVLGTKP